MLGTSDGTTGNLVADDRHVILLGDWWSAETATASVRVNVGQGLALHAPLPDYDQPDPHLLISHRITPVAAHSHFSSGDSFLSDSTVSALRSHKVILHCGAGLSSRPAWLRREARRVLGIPVTLQRHE